MDVYDQIRYELWCEKMGREACHLSPYQISDAFGEEAAEIIPRINAVLKRRIFHLRELMEDAHEEARTKKLDAVFLEFTLKALVMFSNLKSTINVYEVNKTVLSYAIRRKTIKDNPEKNQVGPAEIARAKLFPILSLYSFEKQKNHRLKVQACCPFHGEKSASFFIFQDNKFKCFGCGVHGSAIDFYMKLHSIDFRNAVLALIGV